MNKVNLNTISLNSSSLNAIGEVKRGGSNGEGGGSNAPLDAIGIFIYDIDGKLTNPNDWDSANNDKAVGVYVGTDVHRFVVAKEKSAERLPWGGYNIAIEGIITTTNSADAKLDFGGQENTYKIISQLYGVIDERGNSGAPTCEYCANYIFPNGEKGYLGAAGEWQMVMNNKYQIDSALSKCGGTSTGSNYNIVTSTQRDSKFIWGYDLSGKWITSKEKNIVQPVRPFLHV